MITANQVKEAVLKAGITEIEDHPCYFCGYMTKFTTKAGYLFFDLGCDCTNSPMFPINNVYGNWENREWQDIADWINMQDNEEARKMIAGKFGLE